MASLVFCTFPFTNYQFDNVIYDIGTLGNVITDAMYEYRKNAGGIVDAAIINAGGIRASISAGNVTRGDVLTSFPFMNGIADLVWTGQQVLDIFEGIASGFSTLSNHETTSFIQVSKQIKFSWNPNNANQTRLIDLQINEQPVDPNKNYTLVSIHVLGISTGYLCVPVPCSLFRRLKGIREGGQKLTKSDSMIQGCIGFYGHRRRLFLGAPLRLCRPRVRQPF